MIIIIITTTIIIPGGLLFCTISFCLSPCVRVTNNDNNNNNNNNNKMAGGRCCACNGPYAVCKSCSCVKSELPCTFCRPGGSSACHNPFGRGTPASGPRVPSPLDSDPNSNPSSLSASGQSDTEAPPNSAPGSSALLFSSAAYCREVRE